MLRMQIVTSFDVLCSDDDDEIKKIKIIVIFNINCGITINLLRLSGLVKYSNAKYNY